MAGGGNDGRGEGPKSGQSAPDDPNIDFETFLTPPEGDSAPLSQILDQIYRAPWRDPVEPALVDADAEFPAQDDREGDPSPVDALSQPEIAEATPPEPEPGPLTEVPRSPRRWIFATVALVVVGVLLLIAALKHAS